MSDQIATVVTSATAAPLAEAADFAVSAFNSFLVSADGYRSGRVSTIIAFVTGLFAATGFWANSANRTVLFAPFVGLVLGAGVAVMTFRLYWYQYAYVSWEFSHEYRKEAEEIVSGREDKPFTGTACKRGEISWHKRKESKIQQKWLSLPPGKTTTGGKMVYDECLSVGNSLFSERQLNIWTIFIVLSVGGVVAFAFQIRRRDGAATIAPRDSRQV